MWTLEQAIANEAAKLAEYERDTVAFNMHDKPVTVAQARALFERYHHTVGTDWKRPVNCLVPLDVLDTFLKACEFYHGGKSPRATFSDAPAGFAHVRSDGYAC